jgi:hypothetical protein
MFKKHTQKKNNKKKKQNSPIAIGAFCKKQNKKQTNMFFSPPV